MKKLLQKFILNEAGRVSWMKLGGLIVSITVWLFAQGVFPESMNWLLEMIIAAGAAIGISGARDAIKK